MSIEAGGAGIGCAGPARSWHRITRDFVMKFSTALKISGILLAALIGEIFLVYFIFNNYALTQAETGQYGNIRGAYTTGPLAGVARIFYGIMLITGVLALLPLLAALISIPFRRKGP
jgi:hypothetical protein